MFSEEDLLKMTKGVELYNQGKYWECHEEVEDLWLEEASPVRNVFWALIQVATSLYHLEGDNNVGAIDMMYKAKEKILMVEKSHAESDILYRFLSWKRLKKMVLGLEKGNELEMIKKIHSFRFPDPTKWRMHLG